MRKTTGTVAAALLALMATSCQQQTPEGAATPANTQVSPPSNPMDQKAWENYMVRVSHADLKDVSDAPYLFEVFAPSDPKANEHNRQIQRALAQMAQSNQFPDDAIAIAGPDPHATADILKKAFGAARPTSLRGLTVLYIGNDSEKPTIEKAITTAGATFRFAKM